MEKKGVELSLGLNPVHGMGTSALRPSEGPCTGTRLKAHKAPSGIIPKTRWMLLSHALYLLLDPPPPPPCRML